ncbi:cyclic nucleotide-binding domain-containing protein [Desulfospira joergensenii]|uniref:cyclic nucleotide-binding domain-containing protein n=1 Tax=Desulfospira joergensenii TaxID=53329 RepID=UPI0003B56A12|nr:cyclic nucleotide-binding domain-containing protein [Desulfospira joergensenii]
MKLVEIMEDLPIFKEFRPEELEQILDISSSKIYQSGECLFKEGDPAKEMWIVIDGNVELRFEMPDMRPSTNESTLSSHQKEIPESQVFGWSCFIPPFKMRLSAYCVSRRCQVLKINTARLNHIMTQNREIGFKIMHYLVLVLGFRFKQMQDQVGRFMGVNMMNSW